MSTPPVARRYAKALLDIGIDKGSYDAYGEQLGALGRAFTESKELRTAALNPSIKLETRKAILRAIAEKYGFDPVVRNFTLLLLDKDRFRFVADIAEEYQRQADAHAGRVRARVTSAVELTKAQTDTLRDKLAALTGKEVTIEKSVDPELIGGVVASVGGVVLDGSVRHQLEQLKTTILQEI
jgi:F-type H+-transporting ATPase subunit delta